MTEVVNIERKFQAIHDHWNPRIAAEVNDTLVKLVKFRGEFDWHHHEQEDELFYVVKGTLTMRLRDRDVRVGPGEFVVIPRGAEHMPVANEEAHVILIEPRTTLNTGNARNERTRAALERI